MTDAAVTSQRDERDPWSSYGWVIQSVWLLFLAFPFSEALGGDHSLLAKVWGVCWILAFAVTYLLGTRRIDLPDARCDPRHRTGTTHLAVLTLCAVATVPVIGLDALGCTPFLVSFGMFALPLRWSLVHGVFWVLVTAVIVLLVDSGEGAWVLVIIVVAVGTMTAGIRVMTERGAEYESMSRELALVEERERVARDVHDVLGHSLTVVTVKAELAERLVSLDPDRARAELAEIQSLSRQALAEIRATVGGLRVARLGDELASARTALAGAGITASLPDDPEAVDPRHRIVLAWVLREAVTNVVRHSDADECRVELGSGLLRVTDDGRGLESRPEGNGLRGLRERVRAAGGTLTIRTGPDGHGTVLEVIL